MLDVVSSDPSPAHALRLLTPEALRQNLSASPTVVAVFAEEVLSVCIRAGPGPVLDILNYLIDDKGRLGLEMVRLRLRAPQPVIAHPIEAEIIAGAYPFADRQRLRQTLRKMIDPGHDRPILQITGDRRSGKSWTYQLLRHWAREETGHVICHYEVTEDSGPDAGPSEVACDLVAQLGGMIGNLSQTTNEDAYANDLAQRVIRAANTVPDVPDARVWFVFDGFSQKALRADTAKFFLALSLHCTKGINARRHRVVFCELAYALAAKIRMNVATYETEPLTRDHIRNVVSAAVALRSNLTATDIPAITDAITDAVLQGNAEPYVDLSEIGARLELHICEGQV
ncbi:hypothetical protein [Puniceibacterium confluentis]|uniref:hypothetical protein n=1 Tax=Puniceibacterium confluentis TaxID=1958944 RepID=UPI0011B7DDAC|nr:hypothetical protein [Puniceibacterium confluentis]